MIGQVAGLEQPAVEIDLLICLDNQRWIPKHEDSSRMNGDNLRLMYSSLSRMYMLMGRSREIAAKKKNFGAERSPTKRVQSLGSQTATNGRQTNWLQIVLAVMAILMAWAPCTKAFQAFDCNNASPPVKQYLLLDPEPYGNMQK
jgi:hypothetical protein